ncbi:ArnT family glycosyltransferase [Patescibacteria group bacterium]
MLKIIQYIRKVIKSFKRYELVLLLIILALSVFLRFYNLEKWFQFTWDQIHNAWVMKDMLIDGELPLVGVPIRLNSGFYMGPLYFYLLAPFYWLSGMDPLAGGYFAIIVSMFTILGLYFITRSLFSTKAALISSFIYAVGYYLVYMDRIVWQVIFIPIISYAGFYLLFRILKGNYHLFSILGLLIGFSFHIHFTFIFLVIIAVLVYVYLLVKKQKVSKSVAISLVYFLLFFAPIIIAYIYYSSAGNSINTFINTYYHGFHLVRMSQLYYDAFIQVEQVLFFRSLREIGSVLVILASFLIYFDKKINDGKIISLLILAWFIIPWLVFTVYSGEISVYYFQFNRLLSVVLAGYILGKITDISKFLYIPVILFLGFYAYSNINKFLITGYDEYPKMKKEVMETIRRQDKIEFIENNPRSYLYYYLFNFHKDEL